MSAVMRGFRFATPIWTTWCLFVRTTARGTINPLVKVVLFPRKNPFDPKKVQSVTPDE